MGEAFPVGHASLGKSRGHQVGPGALEKEMSRFFTRPSETTPFFRRRIK